MQALMESRPDLAWLQVDCSNALGELSRTTTERTAAAMGKKIFWNSSSQGGLDQGAPFSTDVCCGTASRRFVARALGLASGHVDWPTSHGVLQPLG